MSVEVVACVIGAVALILAGVMEAVGVMGIFGALRFDNCRRCSRLTIRSGGGEAICRRCRRRDHAQHERLPGARLARPRLAWPHVMRPHLGRPHFGR